MPHNEQTEQRRLRGGGLQPVDGSVRVGTLYRLDEVRRRLGLGNWGFRQMRRAGLPVIRFGGRGYVLGDDVIRFFVNISEKTQNGAK